MTALNAASRQQPIRRVTPVLIAIWGLGVATLLIRLLVALLRLRRLKAASRKAMLGAVPVLVSEQVNTPLTWGVGIRRSVILLPAPLLTGDQTVCESALRHEQAHIVRWDWVWNLLAELVCALCWFQPGAWWLRSRMRLESERACDDRVLLSGIAGPDYAAHLLEIVRSVCKNEVAPAMAQSRGVEERMKHILDGAKPRLVRTRWFAASALLVPAFLSLAALRVSARPAEAKRQTDSGAVTVNSNPPSFGRSKFADPADKSATMAQANAPQVNGSPAATLDNTGPVILLDHVVWGKAVDGLEPGFLLTTPGFSDSRHVPLNSYVTYKVLVRNVTDRNLGIEFQCTKYGPSNSAPYLIPHDDLRSALNSHVIPERYRARGVSDLAEISPAYGVVLAPGEAVVVPEEFGLYIGAADKEGYPRMEAEAIKAGMNWIVQPITIHRLNDAEAAQAESTAKTPDPRNKLATIVERNGRNEQRSVPLVGAGSGGRQLFARIQLAIGKKRDWTLMGQTKSVNAEVFSPDSKRLVTCSADGTAIVWDVNTGRTAVTLKGSTAAISSVLYTPNGKFIITGCIDGTIHIWDATTGLKLRSIAGPGGAVRALDISTDGAKIVAGYDTGTVKVWNTASGQGLGTFAYDNRLLSVAISMDGKTAAAGYVDATIKAWDLQTRHALLSRKIPESEGVTRMYFDRNNTFFTWDREMDGKSKITDMMAWNIEGAKQGGAEILAKITFPIPASTVINTVSNDTLMMLFGLGAGQAVVNDMHAGQVITLDAHQGNVAAVALSPDGTLGATGGQRNGKGEAKIWDIQAHVHTKPAN